MRETEHTITARSGAGDPNVTQGTEVAAGGRKVISPIYSKDVSEDPGQWASDDRHSAISSLKENAMMTSQQPSLQGGGGTEQSKENIYNQKKRVSTQASMDERGN